MFRRKPKDKPNFDWPYTYKYDPPLDWASPPQTWRFLENARDIYFLPIEFVIMFADKERLSKVRRETEYIAHLCESICREGIKVPLELVLDNHGKLRVKEGHHRIVAAQHAPAWFGRLPATLRRVQGHSKGTGRVVVEELEDILRRLSYEHRYES